MRQNLYKSIIGPLFEKDEQGNYTNDALLCQDIIHYCLVICGIDRRFRLRDLQEWVIRNNMEIVNYYRGSKSHTKISNRIHAKEGRINNKFEFLLSLQLIKKSKLENQPSKKLYVDTRVSYEYTKGGIFLALIIEGMNIRRAISLTKGVERDAMYKKLEAIFERIYEVLLLAFKLEDSSASNIFYSALITKLRDKGLVNRFIEHIHHIIGNERDITSMIDLLEYAIYDMRSQNEFQNTFYETVNDLAPDTKKLILYRIKLFAEREFENRKENLTRQYEEFRFQLRANYEIIAVQGYCDNCQKEFNLSIYYKDFLFYAGKEGIKEPCPGCHSNLIRVKD